LQWLQAEKWCVLHLWASETALDVPPLVLVIMSYEKRALLWFPVPADSRFSRKIAKRLMKVLVVLCMLRHASFLSSENVFPTIRICDLQNNYTQGKESQVGNLVWSAETSGNNTNQSDSCVPRNDRMSVCNVFNLKGIGVYVTFYAPWMDLAVRWLGPMASLLLYNFTVKRKIYRERRCAGRLMEKVGISPPLWFHSGITEMELVIRKTLCLSIVMFFTMLPKMLIRALLPLHHVSVYQLELSLSLCL
jgi:hypothetical protein